MSSSTTDKKPENVARGAIHNDRNSEEAKQNAAQRLEEMGEEVPADFSNGQDKEYSSKSGSEEYDAGDHAEDDGGDDGKLEGNRRRGYKATLKNPRVSEQAKEHARKVLDEADE